MSRLLPFLCIFATDSAMKILSAILSIICLTTVSLSARDFRTVDGRHGLSDNYVRDIARDGAGYIWIATQAGVDRYDGYRVKSLAYDGVLSSNPHRLEIDADDRLWVMTADSLYLRNGNRLENVAASPALPVSACRTAYGVIDDDKKGIWILRTDSIFYLDNASGRLTGSRIAFRAQDAATGPDGILLLSPDGNLYRRARTDRQLTRISTASTRHSRLKVTGHTCLLFDGYTPGVESIPLVPTDGHATVFAETDDKLVKDISADPQCNTLLATNNDGIYVYSPAGKLTEIIRHNDSAGSLSSNHISAIYCDERLMVAGTSKQGIGVTAACNPKFVTVPTGIDSDISFIHERADGSVAIGYDGAGLGIYPSPGASSPTHFFTTSSSALPSDLVIGVSRGDRDDIYGTYGGGPFHLDDNCHIKPLTVSDSLRYCRHVVADRRGMWVGTFQNGLFRLGGRHYGTGNSLLHSDCITGLAQAGDSLYVATSHGLSVLNESDGRLERHELFADKAARITTIYLDSRRRLWIGTQDGLAVTDTRLADIAHLGIRDGLPSDVIRAITEDASGRIWLTTAAGISCVRVIREPDGNTYVIRSFSEKDGLGDINFNRYSIARTRGGLILAGGFGKYVMVDPATVGDDTRDGTVYITDVMVNGATIAVGEEVRGGRVPLRGDIMDSRRIEINYDHNLQLALSTLTYTDVDNLRYEYRIDDNDWQLSPSEIISLGEPGAGHHTVSVRVAGRGEVTTIEVTVHPPFYLSTAAYVIYALLLLSGVFVTYRMIRRGHRRAMGRQRVENVLARSENMPVSQDDRFITDAKRIIERHLAQEEFGVEQLSEEMAMSRSNLYKRMTAVAGQTPLEFIRGIRMREGRRLLDTGETSISQIAYSIGMSPKQFAKYFKDETGMTPSAYLRQNTRDNQPS